MECGNDGLGLVSYGFHDTARRLGQWTLLCCMMLCWLYETAKTEIELGRLMGKMCVPIFFPFV
jgi:hypothetical protein